MIRAEGRPAGRKIYRKRVVSQISRGAKLEHVNADKANVLKHTKSPLKEGYKNKLFSVRLKGKRAALDFSEQLFELAVY